MKREFHPLLTLKSLQITEIFFPSMRKESVNVSIPVALQTSIGFLTSTNKSNQRSCIDSDSYYSKEAKH